MFLVSMCAVYKAQFLEVQNNIDGVVCSQIKTADSCL